MCTAVRVHTKKSELREGGNANCVLWGETTAGRIRLYMAVTTSICTVLSCHNSTRKENKGRSTKIKYCTSRRVSETRRGCACTVCGKGGVRRRACPSLMGTVVLRPARMRRALVVQRSAGCGLVPLLLLGLSPAVSAAVALPRSFLPDAVFFSGCLRPRGVHTAMSILPCARDRVTCAVQARQRGVSVYGWHAVVRWERGIAGCERG